MIFMVRLDLGGFVWKQNRVEERLYKEDYVIECWFQFKLEDVFFQGSGYGIRLGVVFERKQNLVID